MRFVQILGKPFPNLILFQYLVVSIVSKKPVNNLVIYLQKVRLQKS